ncbi:MAG: helix-turn-helix transcriptional regulator [Saprospiraceae bacterium]|nr:helix-turn-helix transcriptional regulator [Saprospiraceae bacterium]
MVNKKDEKSTERCSLKEVLDILGGKWAMPIIYTLSNGKMRFKELERSIPHINTRMLVKELKNMEANGIVIREVFATVPPTVEYTLTPKGEKLVPIIRELHKWGEEYSEQKVSE